ncbi:hypothetical protein ASPZODRAFT_136894 [Penicilliopsis zonata CBS 506.65]|uniref:phosphoinositide 5-phosphatase n=1 Tax=Penicilliopsis zonata CBS 506.65 TaxID=1073090 RepID=A0A1L9S783_9EURO|nr:hypothetical protein ASPZODRAFT_136894 [Penicilliopsis zonata CBS 506.65]OJJ43013.1 hypothetical protein ASPZODRAFT_136894 [Penicilliopsis zonata CBS 506.65]
MSKFRIYCEDSPDRSIALVTTEFTLIFRCSPTSSKYSRQNGVEGRRCLVQFSSLPFSALENYRVLGEAYGILGLISVDEDVFLCVITNYLRAATVRPGETVSRIDNVEFYCLNRSEYDYGIDYESRSQFAADDFDRGSQIVTDHPFLALRKLLSDGSFYYSFDFNLTDRLQDRSDSLAAFDIETLDESMLWNSYMISPLLLFRSNLPPHEKSILDLSHILTCVIRGFASTLTIPASVSIFPDIRTNFPSTLTIISRQSSRRAGTRFNSRGIDDDGNVANFVETELILWSPPGIAFSYVQVRGSVPIFWEQNAGFLPGQQKIEITRSFEATQHAFDRHFQMLELAYGAVHVVNLLSELKPGEAALSSKFRRHVRSSALTIRNEESPSSSDHSLLRMTEYDFNAETRGLQGYEASHQIKYELMDSLDGFSYFVSEDRGEGAKNTIPTNHGVRSSTVVLQQEGIFRTNCLDCLDRTNLVQTIISFMALESFLSQQHGTLNPEIQMRHSALWADNGDALSKIYAGTGALKSSFTRHGKMSIAGALADARKSATRLYVNNFADTARQRTIDLLLGHLTNQIPVYLHDPVNDIISDELNKRASEYSSNQSIRIWVGSFNVNGRTQGPDVDLSPWLFPQSNQDLDDPVIFAVGFQEIVELSPQQIMSTDPSTRKVWEKAVKDCLNNRSSSKGTGRYVLLRSGQLVGAALLIFVKEDALDQVKNVEGGVKKTGLSGIGGNKGGCAIRFDFSNTRLCFVTAHLAAGFANFDERNRDYETIYNGLRFQKNRAIEDHDTIIWFGDFNYRIGLENQRVRDLIVKKDYEKLYNNDQLNLQMLGGRAFQFFSEGEIRFAPTYKFDPGTNTYDTSEKSRIPAWCDRVLWKGENIRQADYYAADLRFSDHRPVWALFDCIINVVDERQKEQLRKSLYDERLQATNDPLIDLSSPDHADDIGVPGSIAVGLPPASSDRNRWWLDNGAPARSTIKPPAAGLRPNVNGKSNPFSYDGDDWIPIEKPINRAQDTLPKTAIPEQPPLPPRHDTVNVPVFQNEILDNTRKSSELMVPKRADTLAVDARRPVPSQNPPPVPRKPVSLSMKSEDKQ